MSSSPSPPHSSRLVESTAEEFHRLLIRDGGCASIDDLSPEIRQRTIDLGKRFQVLCSFIESATESDATAWVRSLRLDWVNNPSANAIAILGAKSCHVGFYLGVLEQLWYVCAAAATHPLCRRDLPNPIQLNSRDELESWHQEMCAMFRGPVSPEARAKLDACFEVESPRLRLTVNLYMAAIDYLFMHEIHHFWCGHIFAFEGPRQFGLAVRPSRAGAVLDPALRKALEFHADMFAVRRILEIGGSGEPFDAGDYARTFLTAVSLLFMVADPNPVTASQWSAPDYPHPHCRFFNIASIVESLVQSELRLTPAGWEQVFSSWMNDVALIERICGKRVVVPFTQALAEPHVLQAQFDEAIANLKASTPNLEAARVEMLSYFRQVA